MMGFSSLLTGDLAQAHYDDAIGLYDPAAHLSLGMRFGQDGRIAILSYRSVALWMLGYPDAALADANNSLQRARKIDQAGSLLFALSLATVMSSFAEITPRPKRWPMIFSPSRTKKARCSGSQGGRALPRLALCGRR